MFIPTEVVLIAVFSLFTFLADIGHKKDKCCKKVQEIERTNTKTIR